MCAWQVKLCDPLVTRVISERFEVVVHDDKALYKYQILLLLLKTKTMVVGSQTIDPHIELDGVLVENVDKTRIFGKYCDMGQ